MAETITYDFEDPSEYTFDSNKVDISGGTAKLKLIDLPAQTFNQPFTSDSGFTYDNTKAQFNAGKVEQFDTRPADATLYAGFPVDKDSSWGDGSTTNSLINGATWDNGRIDLTNFTGKRLHMPGLTNFSTIGSAGCIRFTYRPNYSGAPASTRQILEYDAVTGNNNAILASHSSGSGHMIFDLRDSAGGAHNLIATGINYMVAGTDYVIELNFDFSSTSRVFVDGVLEGSSNTSPFTRVGENGTFKWGGAGGTGDFWIDDVILFSTVQHTAAHPGELPYSYNNYIYPTSKVELPQFAYSGTGNIQEFTSLVTTEAGAPREVWNDLYWSGSAWVASNGDYSQANSKADILSNIAAFPASDTLDIDIVFPDSNSSASDIDDLTVTYSGQIYPTDNPTIVFNTPFQNEGLITFTEDSIIVGSDEVKSILSKDTQYYYYSASWVFSDSTYPQSNTSAEINTNAATFNPGLGISTSVTMFLHSDDGSTTPIVEEIVATYDFSCIPPATEESIIFGFLYGLGGPLVGKTVSVRLGKRAEISEDIIFETTTVSDTTCINGSWDVTIVYQDPKPTILSWNINGEEIMTNFPKQAQTKFSELTIL